LLLLNLGLFHGTGVKSVCFPRFYCYGVFGAVAKAVSQAIAQLFGGKDGFPVDYFYRAFRA
jgi:hypothetical protein